MNENDYILEILGRAHDAGLIDESDVWSLGIGAPELIKRLKERAIEQDRNFAKIFTGLDIN